ncbi:MAG: hypothetical protein PW786_00045 [Arachidicoccus sp.]|nr:hypothetical protein [Arachidicoccus sp.]
MEEKEISPEQSLQIIEKMLADARNRFCNNGFALLFWGVWIILMVVGDYITSHYFQKYYSNYIWMISIVVGMLFTFLFYAFAAPKKRVFTRLDSINGKLWIAFGISFLLLMFLCYKYKADGPPFIYCMIGLCMFASGGIYKFWSLYAGAFVFWLGAIVWWYFPAEIERVILTVFIMFLGYLVPGYLLWRKAKKEANV